MAKCKNCTNLYNMSNENDEIVGKWCPKTNDSPDVESERECRHYKCMTQSDRIRSMSDEELAEWLTSITDDAQSDAKSKCDYQWSEWLQSEVEECHER